MGAGEITSTTHKANLQLQPLCCKTSVRRDLIQKWSRWTASLTTGTLCDVMLTLRDSFLQKCLQRLTSRAEVAILRIPRVLNDLSTSRLATKGPGCSG